MVPILKAYLKRLTNLSSRNKSLLLSRLSAEQFLDLHETDYLLSKPSFDLLAQLIQKKKRIPLCDAQDPRFDKVNDVSKKLRRIARTDRLIQDERGARDLYVGYPFVRGKFSDGSVVHAPLLFFPVSVRLDREQWCLASRDEAEVSLNRSFALAYGHFHETKIPDDVLEKSFDEFPTDALEFRTALYEWLKETPFRLNFNQELFENKFQAFDARTSSDLRELEKEGELKLYSEIVLGIFPQAGSYLVPDYQFLLEEAENGVLSLPLFQSDTTEGDVEAEEIAAGPAAVPEPPALREEHIRTPLPMDLSQENVVRLVKQGESVVVQGPPGTGKSQLICNLMADFASQGLRVLLVCQKRAALDVVHQRLKGVHLDPFTALIHDFRTDRAALYQQIATQIEKIEEYTTLNYSLDAVFLDREFGKNSRLIDRTVADLEEFKMALFDRSECGLSVKELYLSSDPEAPRVDLGPYYREFPLLEVDDYRRRLQSFVTYHARIGRVHSWYDRKSFAPYGAGELHRLVEVLASWPGYFRGQAKQFEENFQYPFSPDLLPTRQESVERITALTTLVAEEQTFGIFQRYLRSPQPVMPRLAFIRQVVDTLEGWQQDGLEIEGTLQKEELPDARASVAKALQAKESPLSGQWWEWFGKEKAVVTRLAKAHGLRTRSEDLQELDRKIHRRLELEGWLGNPLLAFSANDIDSAGTFEEQYLTYFQRSERAADAAGQLGKPPWSPIFLDRSLRAHSLREFLNSVRLLQTWSEEWEHQEAAMRQWVVESQWQKMLLSPAAFVDQLQNEVQRDFDSLVEMDRLQAEFSPAEKALSTLILEQLGREKTPEESKLRDQAAVLLDTSLRLAWIDHIEARYPILRAVSSLKMEEWEQQLQTAIEKKQHLSQDITLLHLREGTYRAVEKNRLGNRTTYRELYHQVTKKRNIWPIRKVVETYAEDVFRLIPCWMASPEAVSTLFPMRAGLFDLVIFDEASQCYAEYGLPAVYRGRQLVITGDSKQLPPSDLYRVRFEESTGEEELPVALETESLLDLAAQSLAQQQLTGHYRSNSLDLIDFSNRHFYKNTLRLLPDFSRVNDTEPGIRYLHVDGVWENNANQAEAQRVLQLVRELFDSGLSIGIVTFNFHQQQLIQDTLERENCTANGLFVKNIENVQGDERDVIIFSVGYAPDARAKLAMQFGTLNTQGGENRLNVAITRARQQIYMVTSLWPHQLRTEQTANPGPKLLKEYLQYALDVSEGKYRPQPAARTGYESPWLLKDRIARQNPQYRPELPFADLTLRSGGTYQGLLLTDDDLYFSSTSAKEPHAYLPIILRAKHWPFRRVYSREYWRKPNEVPEV